MTESTVLTLTASGLLPKSARSFGLHCSWVASNNVSLQVVLVVRLVVALGALRLLLYFPIPVLLNMLFTFSDASCGEVALIALPKLHIVRILVVHVHLLGTSTLPATFSTLQEHTHVNCLLVSFQSNFSC